MDLSDGMVMRTHGPLRLKGCAADTRATMVDVASAAAVLVRVQGPDPKGTKRNDQSFSLFDAGITTLSCSGTIMKVGERLVVVTSAHVLRPFLTKKNKCVKCRCRNSSPTVQARSSAAVLAVY